MSEPFYLPVRFAAGQGRGKVHFIEEGRWDRCLCGWDSENAMLVKPDITDEYCKSCIRVKQSRESKTPKDKSGQKPPTGVLRGTRA